MLYHWPHFIKGKKRSLPKGHVVILKYDSKYESKYLIHKFFAKVNLILFLLSVGWT